MTTRRRTISKQINSKSNPFVIKTYFEAICKCLGKSALRENFNPKPERHTEKPNQINQAFILTKALNREREREVYPISFICVWTTFKHQVQDLYAPQNVLVFLSDRRPKTHFRHEQGYHWLYALICSFIFPQKATFEVNGVEHQKTANNEKNFKPNKWFSEVIKKTFATTFNQPKLQHTKTYNILLFFCVKGRRYTLQSVTAKNNGHV